jgi:polygalacturonase
VKPNSISSGAGRWLRIHDISLVNVKWFGARGDHASGNTQAGTPANGTDDTAAFQAAIDSVGTINAEVTVYVPFTGVIRSYKLTNTLRLYQGTRLIGSAEQPGMYPELAFYVGDTVDGIAPNNVGVSFPSRMTIKGLRIREYSIASTRQNTGVRMDHVANGYKIESVMVSGFRATTCVTVSSRAS